jgi:hypothetical protein
MQVLGPPHPLDVLEDAYRRPDEFRAANKCVRELAIRLVVLATVPVGGRISLARRRRVQNIDGADLVSKDRIRFVLVKEFIDIAVEDCRVGMVELKCFYGGGVFFTAITVSKPSRLSPVVMPPAPANNSTALGGPCFIFSRLKLPRLSMV